MITDHLSELVRDAVGAATADGAVPEASGDQIVFERPKKREHGDWATNVALTLARGGGNPRAIAQALLERVPQSTLVERVEVAGPGFLNFHLAATWLHDIVREAATAPATFGRKARGTGQAVNVEYVSANPTGPINVVGGRYAAVGDTIAALLEATGNVVTREFYVNDAGWQMTLFAGSVAARYLQQLGVDAELPADGYPGDYVVDLAKELVAAFGDRWLEASPGQRLDEIGAEALARMLEEMRSSLDRFGTTFDVWFRESELHRSGAVQAAMGRLREAGFCYEHEGAVWFRSSTLGDDKDRVLVRANGTPTYSASDVAYLLDKFGRGFDRLIYLWGPDHHGTVARVLAAAEALGFDRADVELRIGQIVTLARGGAAVKASKRAGVLVPLDELVTEVGRDAARYVFLNRSLDVPIEFDIDLAKQEAPENPVYYVQYAHARISSILRNAAAESIDVDAAQAHLSRLGAPSEVDLMRHLAAFEEMLLDAAAARAPQKVTRYVEDLAAAFSAFYRDCRVLTDDAELTQARLTLCVAARNVIAQSLRLLGVSAPERM